MQHLQMNNHMRGSDGEVGVFNLYSDLFFEAAGLALVRPVTSSHSDVQSIPLLFSLPPSLPPL